MDAITSLCGNHSYGRRHHTPVEGGWSADSISLGESSENPGIYKASKETVRPEVGAVLDRVADCNVKGIVHTTRSIPRTSLRTPEAPQPFAAGRFHVLLEDPKTGDKFGFVMQTEEKVGHLGKVVPGETDCGGHVSLLANPEAPNGKETPLNRTETDRLIGRLYQRYAQPMTDKQAEGQQSAINFATAVRYSGEGREAVLACHGANMAQVREQQGPLG